MSNAAHVATMSTSFRADRIVIAHRLAIAGAAALRRIARISAP